MNHLRGDSTHIHINCTTQKKDPITLSELVNTKSMKAPKHNTTTKPSNTTKSNRDFKSKSNKSTNQDTKSENVSPSGVYIAWNIVQDKV